MADSADRENEGDLIMAAEKVTPAAIAFMVRYTSGVICAPLQGARLDVLEVPLMVPRNTENQRTAFTVSVDAVDGVSTGISAADRATTIRALIDPHTRPADLARPGPRVPVAGAAWRSAATGGPYRGGGGPGLPGGAAAGGRVG